MSKGARGKGRRERTRLLPSTPRKLPSCASISIVPWWYARLLTSLNAEPETCFTLNQPTLEKRRGRTHLEPLDADVVPVIHVRLEIQLLQPVCDEFRIRLPIEFEARDEDAIVGVSQVLSSRGQRGVRREGRGGNERGRLSLLRSFSAQKESRGSLTAPNQSPSTDSALPTQISSSLRPSSCLSAPDFAQ